MDTADGGDDASPGLDAADADASDPLPPIDWTLPTSGVTCAEPNNCVDSVNGLSLDWYDTCVIKSDAQVWCWGSTLEFDDYEPTPVPHPIEGLTGVVTLDGYMTARCAVKLDGTVWCWGHAAAPLFGPNAEQLELEGYYYGPVHQAKVPVQIPELDHIKSVAVGYRHVCALRDDGGVWCWGDSPHGQLGNESVESSPAPVRVEGIPQARALTTSGETNCIASVAGDVYCWGVNVFGELGDGSQVPEYPYYPYHFSAVPIQVLGVDGVVALSSGNASTCALTDSQQVACWGSISQAGLHEANTATPVVIDHWTGATDVSLGLSHGCAVLPDGRVSCLGTSDSGQTGTIIQAPTTPVFVEGIEDAVMVDLGAWHSCAVNASGEVSCWGDDAYGKLGDGTAGVASSDVPLRVASSDAFSAVAIGDSACGLKTNGEVSCWGGNYNGELGVDPALQVVSGTPIDIPNLHGVTSVSGGHGHFCAHLDNETVSCWGDNTYGQLGDADFTDLSSTTPIAVAEVTDVIAVRSSVAFSCALLGGGTVSCWGSNEAGQLGLDPVAVPFSAAATPVPDVTDAVELEVGVHHACARRSDLSVMCWGGNFYSQFGPNTPDPAPPMTVPAFDGAAGIGAGHGLTCLLNDDDTVACTGTTFMIGGDAGVDNPPVPVAGLSNVASMTPRCAIRNDGSFACWTDPAHAPVDHDGGPLELTEFSEFGSASHLDVSEYGFSACAVLTADSSIVCWGDNSSNELGVGHELWRANPEPVAWPN